MSHYRITMHLKIEAVVEAADAKAVAETLGRGVGDVLLSMGAGDDDNEGLVTMQGDIMAVDGGNSASLGPAGSLN